MRAAAASREAALGCRGGGAASTGRTPRSLRDADGGRVGPRSPVTGCPDPTYPLHGAGRPCGARRPCGREACRTPGAGSGARRAAAEQRDASNAGPSLQRTAAVARGARHHLRRALRPASRAAGKASPGRAAPACVREAETTAPRGPRAADRAAAAGTNRAPSTSVPAPSPGPSGTHAPRPQRLRALAAQHLGREERGAGRPGSRTSGNEGKVPL